MQKPIDMQSLPEVFRPFDIELYNAAQRSFAGVQMDAIIPKWTHVGDERNVFLPLGGVVEMVVAVGYYSPEEYPVEAQDDIAKVTFARYVLLSAFGSANELATPDEEVTPNMYGLLIAEGLDHAVVRGMCMPQSVNPQDPTPEDAVLRSAHRQLTMAASTFVTWGLSGESI